ncbi:carboxypeptidase-like regulatory domain-containing protein [Spirosoma sp. KNUC1025]|uniref:carboxypeptidase-like regulatory domain-containing protein n=1 Tax=Spirosoma sp. KNUC1025 TaxID=2894082 RepID=UPI00386E2EC5|nr:carboxypeptidase-like regulatory domain-containing protein [Spirosoma sp. KNUC1025]
MFATNPTRFPEFVADQILTAQNLQDLFNYLDEQERLTRTNLIGIGIVCGLEVFVSSTGNAVTITQGVGITSSGYLVAVPQRTYTFFSDYNAEKDRYYDRFVDTTTKKQLFPLWELAVAGSPEAKTALSADFLKDKVVLIFVELIENGNKNCDPDSCDDKGITVDIVFRPLLVEEKNVGGLLGSLNGNDPFKKEKPCSAWPEVKMPRYNVPATTLPDSASILKNFLMLLNESFVGKIEATLTSAYDTLQLVVATDFNQNPFVGFKNQFSFLFDGSIGIPQLLHIQYFYDFFSDLLQAYDELRQSCQRHMSLCCPDENLFPRHLLLGAAFQSAKLYRHTFIPSPALGGSYEVIGELRFLFARLVQLVKTVQIPAGVFNVKQRRTPIVVTPSKLGDVPLSEKAIPYYYDVLQAPALFDGWNFRKTQNGKGNTNLSYYAQAYNATDEHVRFPLNYDLEPYNFFRIEGHIGQPWQTAFRQIYQIKQQQRLPFDVVALNGDFRSLIALLQQSLNNLGKVLAEQPEKWRQILCYFNDIEMQYDMQAAELRCTLGKVMRFLYDVGAKDDPDANLTTPVSQLLRKFDSSYQTKPGSLGATFDKWYPTVKDQPYITPSAILGGNLLGNRLNTPLILMYYLEKIHEALPEGIIQLNINDLTTRLRDASTVAESLLQTINTGQDQDSNLQRDLILNLNAVIRVCKGGLLQELYRNFLFRFYLFMANQSFAMFSFLNSGIQHKAGVPVGGTFILVYHDALPQRDLTNNIRGFTGDLRTGFSNNDTTFATNAGDAADTATRNRLTNLSSASASAFQHIKSVKDAGTYWLVQLLAARSKEDELTDKELLELVGEIPDGVVIADFYLPYVCASECAPMSYIVLGDDKEEPPTEIIISGTVTDAVTGGPIERAKVQLKGTSTATITDANGHYTIIVPDNTAVLGFGADGYNPEEIPIGDKTTVDAALKPLSSPLTITGRIMDAATGGIIVNATVLLKGTQTRTVTDGNGNYSLNVPDNSAVLVFSANGYEQQEKPVGTNTTVDAALKPVVVTRTVRGIVTDATTNQPLAGPTIAVKGTTRGASTDANGKYQITGVAADSVLIFNFIGYEPQEITVGTQTTINVAMKPLQVAEKCTSLGTWSTAFKKLDSSTDSLFPQFKQRFAQYAKVVDAFGQVATFLTKPQGDQLAGLAQVMPPAALLEWIRALRVVILEFPPIRQYALELIRILTGVIVFYSCVPKEDIDKAQVQMINVWAFLTDGILSGWKNIQNLSAADRAVIVQMTKDLRAELDRTSTNEPDKQQYIRMLKFAIDSLSAI